MRRVLTICLLAGMLGFAPRAAEAAPVRAVLLEGRGWGHGRGMGQWGARGMALDGAGWKRIVRHYYRAHLGTSPRHERIRVLLTSRHSVIVSSAKPFALRWRGHSIGARANRLYRLTRTTHGTVLSSARSVRAGWHRIAIAHGTVRTVHPRARLQLGSGAHEQRRYRGLLVFAPHGRRLRVIDDVAMEDYLRGVVPREMPAAWPVEALKAQAVAARTYAERVRAHARRMHAAWDICDDARCQVYGGAARRAHAGARWRSLESPRTNLAVRATARRVLTYKGAPILAEYSSSTGGFTVGGGVGYLRAVRDPADRGSPFHQWAREITAREVQAEWPAIGRFAGVRVTKRDGHGQWGGRALRVIVAGSRRSIPMRATEFQARLGLRSRWFTVAHAPTHYVFRHNLGYGTHSLAVTFLQERLRAEGVYPDNAPISSYFGSITRGSVARYQRAHGLSATGFLGRRTRASLNARARKHHGYAFRFDMGYGTRAKAVSFLQRRLRAEGVYPRGAPITRFFGPITRGAVRRYQRAHHLPATGFLGPRTRARLNHS